MQLPRSSPARRDSRQRPEEPESVETAVARREALEELLRTDGWQLFVGHVLQECQGSGYHASMNAAFASDDPNMPKVVHRVAQGILRLLQWPTDQLEGLKGTVDDE